MNTQRGFTLIELVMVIVILGILAATALPKFVNLSSDAAASAAQGLLGGLRSAAAIDQAQYYISTGTGLITTDTELYAAMDGVPTGCDAANGDDTFDCTFGSTTYTFNLTDATASSSAVIQVAGQSW